MYIVLLTVSRKSRFTNSYQISTHTPLYVIDVSARDVFGYFLPDAINVWGADGYIFRQEY